MSAYCRAIAITLALLPVALLVAMATGSDWPYTVSELAKERIPRFTGVTLMAVGGATNLAIVYVEKEWPTVRVGKCLGLIPYFFMAGGFVLEVLR